MTHSLGEDAAGEYVWNGETPHLVNDNMKDRMLHIIVVQNGHCFNHIGLELPDLCGSSGSYENVYAIGKHSGIAPIQ